jgi:hypothetical protein
MQPIDVTIQITSPQEGTKSRIIKYDDDNNKITHHVIVNGIPIDDDVINNIKIPLYYMRMVKYVLKNFTSLNSFSCPEDSINLVKYINESTYLTKNDDNDTKLLTVIYKNKIKKQDDIIEELTQKLKEKDDKIKELEYDLINFTI